MICFPLYGFHCQQLHARLLDSDELFTGGVVNGATLAVYTFHVWIRIAYALAYVPAQKRPVF